MPAEFDKYRSQSGRYASTGAFETLRKTLNARIYQNRLSRQHQFGIASTSVPPERAERIKTDYLPNLRVARMIDGTTKGLFRCEEIGIASFLIQTAEAFEACRSRVRHTLPVERGASLLEGAGPVVLEVAGDLYNQTNFTSGGDAMSGKKYEPKIQAGTIGGVQTGDNNVQLFKGDIGAKGDELRAALSELADKLAAEEQTALSAEAKETTAESDDVGLAKRATELVEKVEKTLGNTASIGEHLQKLKGLAVAILSYAGL